MSNSTSPGIAANGQGERVYGVERVCRVWKFPRSTFYAWRKDQLAEPDAAQAPDPVIAKKRGPPAEIADDDLLREIREDLRTSPFQGEGHRKVWARLLIGKSLHVSAKRVLRLMRDNSLLSPRRVRQGDARLHDGHIVTDAPNLMWGTDGWRAFTVDDGWVWGFVAVEHWNAECVGWHVCKKGDRFAALQPIAMGLANIYGAVGPDTARGLLLRMDHGTQYLSDHFRNQVRYWGIAESYAFVEEPQTNGVAERFNRTLKEQVIHGRVFGNLEELRAAVGAFVERYNREWRVEKLNYLSPLEARAAKDPVTRAA